MADGKLPAAKIIEIDADSVYIGDWDGPAESNSYNYRGKTYTYTPLNDFLLRTNHPLSSQVFTNYKSTIDSTGNATYLSGPRYRALKNGYREQLGYLSNGPMMEIMRNLYKKQVEIIRSTALQLRISIQSVLKAVKCFFQFREATL